VEHFHWKSSGQECSLFALAAATTPSLAPIHRQSWVLLEVCSPMWFTISLDPPPSTWRRKYGQVVPEMTSLEGNALDVLLQSKEILPSLVHTSACRCSYIHEYSLAVVCMLCSGISGGGSLSEL